ncbi:hypothetical protein [Neoaquamicrobium sediminum]|uniref:hypothetical protein n=1 Tax=Neoaquamicrobium sediminum TaxID=1849104 RepID=UPI0015636CE2|nr:hypothetical protein [Mesorhizobium sediminum]NRC54165.1 hypothetical protein [Mesorhizobium sediminum]
MKRVVITHPQMGVYLGNAMGFGFFSLLDCVGHSQAVSFGSVSAAQEHIKNWANHSDPATFAFVEVDAHEEYVDVISLVQAGVPSSMLEPMIALEQSRVRAMQITGQRFQ